MLLNISSDRIIFVTGDERIILPYGELEKNLPQFLYSHISPNTTESILVINGPGSFTNLRIATLAFNTMNMLHNFPVIFSSISKTSYLQYLYSIGGAPGKYCVMYIGQKKRYRIVDLSHIENIVDESSPAIKKIHIDALHTYVNQLDASWFVDELVAEGKESLDTIFGEGQYSMITFSLLPSLPSIGEKLLQPNYMIAANIQ